MKQYVSVLELYFKQIKNIPVLDKKTELKLFKQYKRNKASLFHVFYFGQVLYDVLVLLQEVLYKNKRIHSVFMVYDLKADDYKKAKEPLAKKYYMLSSLYKTILHKKQKKHIKKAVEICRKLPWKTYLLVKWADKIIAMEKRYKKNKKLRRHILKNSFMSYKEFVKHVNEIKKNRDKFIKIESELCNSNLKLVVSVAKKYKRFGLPFEDLIQEGNIGLLNAIARFNPTKKHRFSTYATWWIKQAIINALFSQTRLIRLPQHAVKFYNLVMQYSADILQKTGREPTVQELSKKIGAPKEKILNILKTIKAPVSMNAPVHNDEPATYEYFMQDNNAVLPSCDVDVQLVRQHIEYILSTKLTPNEKKVIIYRFGLKNGERKTLEELSKEMSLTRERVRQIEKEAIAKLQKYNRKTGAFCK